MSSVSIGHAVMRHGSRIESVAVLDETLLYDGMYLRRLPPTASRLWNLVDGHRSALQIAALAAAEHPEQPAESVTRDVLAFLSELLGLTVLELAMLDRTTFHRPDEVGWERDGAAVLLVDLRDSRRRALSPTAGLVWERICEDGDAEHVIRELQAAYPDSPTLPDDISALLVELEQEGWLVRHDAVVESSQQAP